LQVILTALASKSNVSIVSQPQLLVNDNEKGSFTTKVSQPTTVLQTTATVNTNVQSFGGFADATTALEITPRISPDNYLNLEIVQTFEEFTGQASAGGIPPPKVSNNATTKVTIPNRQTIVIGGFTRDSSELTRTGIPGLMNIPGLGKVFSRENKRKTISRLYLFVRPIILNEPDFGDLRKASEIKKDDLETRTKKSRVKTEINEGIGRKAEVVPVTDEDR
jgi:general secretion pathway protein D